MKILFIITGLGYGGAETQLLYLSTELVRLGHDCHVCSMTCPREIEDSFKTNGIKVYSLDSKPGKVDFFSILKFRKLVKEVNPDVIHSHMIHANIFSRISLVGLNFPLINTAHNVYEGGRGLEFIHKLTDKLCDHVTQVSHEGLERYISTGLVKSNKASFMRNAVQLPSKTISIRNTFNFKHDDFIFLAIGRLEEVKDYPNLLNAIKIINNKKIKFLIAGRGVLHEQLTNMVTDLNILDQVFFLGARNDISNLIASVDAFIMSSKYEGLPISVLEAMAQGLPIVSTNVGALPDLIKDDINGYLVPIDSPIELAQAINKLINNSSLDSFGAISKQIIINNYSSEEIAKNWLTLYESYI